MSIDTDRYVRDRRTSSHLAAIRIYHVAVVLNAFIENGGTFDGKEAMT